MEKRPIWAVPHRSWLWLSARAELALDLKVECRGIRGELGACSARADDPDQHG
jgi:hypothetical protein